MILEGLPPIVDDDVRVIILGSFPGEESLRKKQYYAHPRNQFWMIMGEVLGVPLSEKNYEERKAILLAHHVGVWDAYARCERTGSLDKNIKNPVPNDFFTLQTPHLRAIFCNGQKSSQAGYLLPMKPIVLPSTSPASTMTLPEKIAEWRKLKKYLR